jgi:spermidine synthase
MKRGHLVVAIFVLSGAAGLIYEVVWARQLVLVFGNTTQAISAILTGFFGGMAIGSVFGGRAADRVARPLRLFAFLELVLAVVVVCTPLTFRLIHEAYRSAFSALEANPALLVTVRFVLALAALGPATLLMGATLPTLTRHLARDPSRMSAAFGRLYAANTAGAIVGTLAAGFVLIELLGLARTLLVGAACSAIAGTVAFILDRSSGVVVQSAQSIIGTRPGDVRSRRARTGLVLAIAFASGLTSLGYQVLWTRLLASGTGNSTYVFTAILATFLAGIALGAAAFGLYRNRIEDPVNFIAHGQLVIAILVLIGAVTGMSRNSIGFIAAGQHFLAGLAFFAATVAIIVFPATFVMGLTFPALAALGEGSRGKVGSRAGSLLAANTFGAIVGTVAIPFVLIPAVGSPDSLAILILANVAIAVVLALYGGIERALPRRVLIATGAVLTVFVWFGIRSGDVFRDPAHAHILANGTLFESREDQIASVQAGETTSRHLWVTGTSMTSLTIDAQLMTLLPVMLRPDARSVLTVAFGMGTSFKMGVLLGLETEAVELVPSVPKMFRWFHPDAADILKAPNGRIIISDGRNHVELTDRRYDIIVTDPPPPIESAGVSVIASLEYYEAGRDRLNPRGVMMQWVPYGATVDEFKAHVRTFARVFPNMIVAVGPGRNGFFMLGSRHAMSLDTTVVREVLARPGVLPELEAMDDAPSITREEWPRLIEQAIWLQGAQVRRYAGDGPLITDDHPLPEYFVIRHLTTKGEYITPSSLQAP